METENHFKFFIVDDDAYYASLYQQHLNNINYFDVTYFSNGKDCLNNLHQNPDIIFLDHNMDDITGFEVLKKIKRQNPNIYVIMISGQDQIATAVDALKFGAFDYVIKGSDVCDKMTLLIEKIIKIKEQLKKSNPSLFQKILSKF